MNYLSKTQNILIENNRLISAIYYSMLQCGYDFFEFERSQSLIDKINYFKISNDIDLSFFTKVRQNNCEAYPYWPRAAILETASFFINVKDAQFTDLGKLKQIIMSAENISDNERTYTLWEWIENFPITIQKVLHNKNFNEYFKWEQLWITQQDNLHKEEKQYTDYLIKHLNKKYSSPINDVSVILNPIKCVYSADYHYNENNLIVCSGIFNTRVIIHEYLHHIVHTTVLKQKSDILNRKIINLNNIDSSYYINSANGILNAFEEHIVRNLTDKIIANEFPDNIDKFILELL